MANRFYLPGNWQPGDLVPLPQPEAQHALRVLRLSSGEQIEVFDGAGRAAPAELQVESSRKASVRITNSLITDVPSQPSIAVALAPPKGDRFRWIVEKLTELGVDRIAIIESSRSVVRWREAKADKALERLDAVARSAACQSRRVWLPEVVGPIAAAEALGWAGAAVAQKGGEAPSSMNHTLLIGPEGGWTEAELEAAAHRVDLGPGVLRAETAAVAGATLLCGIRGHLVRGHAE
ncbi:MAG: 16S rRNA (uracil(1498)-N(3))-methyltransferase [Planctomycetaceae bacterium]|nr:16S rRNA (uracil(1498)-N(3))-methyltransferase [Planctomycetaceae bacterium]